MIKALLAMVALVLVFSAAAVFGSDRGVPVVVIDARTDAEWNAGHLEGAVLIPYDQVLQGIGKAASDKHAKIYLYCRTGRRSGIALDTLKKSGYTDVDNLGTMENAAQKLDRKIVR